MGAHQNSIGFREPEEEAESGLVGVAAEEQALTAKEETGWL